MFKELRPTHGGICPGDLLPMGWGVYPTAFVQGFSLAAFAWEVISGGICRGGLAHSAYPRFMSEFIWG